MKRLAILVFLLIPSLTYPWVYREQFNGTVGPHYQGETFEPGGNMSCYVTSNKGEAGVITDSTTLDPTKSLYIKFNSGAEDSAEIVSCSSDYEIPVGTTQMYVQWKFKYATSWMLHPDYDKQLYFKDVNSTPVFTVGIRDPSSYPYPVITKGSNSTTGDGYRYPNITGTEIVFGQWYTADLWIKFGTPGAANGEFKLWVNGVLQSSYTGVKTLGSGSVRTKYFSLTPVWGGNQTLVAPRDMYKYFDDVIWSNEPISGGTETDTTPPYISSRDPSSGASGVAITDNTVARTWADAGDGVDADTMTITVGGTAYDCADTDNVACTGTAAARTITFTRGGNWDYGQTVSVGTYACDTAGNCANDNTTFTTAAGTPVTLAVTTTALGTIRVGTAYSVSLASEGGTSPYSYAVTAGTIPAGLALASSGAITGTPTTDGAYSFTVTVTDANSDTDSQQFTGTVLPKLPGGQVTTTSFTLTDTYVNSGAKTTNYSDNTANRLYQWPLGTVANRTLVQVASLGLPDNIAITSATLYMYLSTWDGSGGTSSMNAYVYPVTGQSWTIANVTWNTLDNSAVGSYESVTAVPLTAGWYSWTVTEMTKAAYAADGALTVLLDGGLDGAADTNRYFTSMDGTEAQRPYLSVTYTLLTPGGVPVSAPGRMRVSKFKGAMR